MSALTTVRNTSSVEREVRSVVTVGAVRLEELEKDRLWYKSSAKRLGLVMRRALWRDGSTAGGRVKRPWRARAGAGTEARSRSDPSSPCP